MSWRTWRKELGKRSSMPFFYNIEVLTLFSKGISNSDGTFTVWLKITSSRIMTQEVQFF